MTMFDGLAEKVREVLLTDWDPVGIHDVPKAHEEYDQYVIPIVKMMSSRSSAFAIAKHLLEIEINVMGLKGNAERARLVAEKLRSLLGR